MIAKILMITKRLRNGQTILQKKKGHMHLIHISEFINPETGWFVYQDDNGVIIDEAREIIYSGSNGDAW